MLSNKQIKHFKSLHTKKFRLENKQFIIEGHRIIKQALKANVKFDGVWCTEDMC